MDGLKYSVYICIIIGSPHTHAHVHTDRWQSILWKCYETSPTVSKGKHQVVSTQMNLDSSCRRSIDDVIITVHAVTV